MIKSNLKSLLARKAFREKIKRSPIYLLDPKKLVLKKSRKVE